MFWVAGLVAADRQGMATVKHMREHVSHKGLPYLLHFGMWNDVVVIHPWCALMVGLFGQQWFGGLPTVGGVAILALSLLFSLWANYTWAKQSEIVEAHSYHGRMNLVGVVYIPHMTIIVAIIFATLGWAGLDLVPWQIVVGSIFILTAHLSMGYHWPVKLLNPAWSPFKKQESFIGAAAVVYGVFTSLGLMCIFGYFVSRA